jgi:muramoyltetrapeptide carboxypeptidase
LEPKGKIIFLEDGGEPGYKIDRMLTQLRGAGAFQGARAVVLGEFTPGDGFTEFALDRFARELGKPVFRSDKFGHGPKNYPLILNAPAVINRSGADVFSLVIDGRALVKK